MVERVAEAYDTSSAGGKLTRCPGEDNCQDWQAAGGTTHAEKEEAVCFGCHLFPTKINFSAIREIGSEAVLAEVEQVRRERDSGGGVNLAEMSFLTWRLLLIWDAEVEARERGLRLYAKALFEALAARGV